MRLLFVALPALLFFGCANRYVWLIPEGKSTFTVSAKTVSTDTVRYEHYVLVSFVTSTRKRGALLVDKGVDVPLSSNQFNDITLTQVSRFKSGDTSIGLRGHVTGFYVDGEFVIDASPTAKRPVYRPAE